MRKQTVTAMHTYWYAAGLDGHSEYVQRRWRGERYRTWFGTAMTHAKWKCQNLLCQ